jgi:hypothetical protein
VTAHFEKEVSALITIAPTEVLYIKLGRAGDWEEACLTEGTLRLGYIETPHDQCLAGKWDKVREERARGRASKGSAVHSPTPDLAALYPTSGGNIDLLLPAAIARLAVQYGLAGWVIDKAS